MSWSIGSSRQSVRDDRLYESVELRIIRQSVARTDFLDMTNQGEAVALADNFMSTGRQAIIEFWEDENLAPTQAATLSDWVWRIVTTTALPSRRVSTMSMSVGIGYA